MNGTATVSHGHGSSNVKQEVVDLTDNDDEAGNSQDDGDKYSYPLSQYDSDYEEDDDQNQNQNNPHPLTIKQKEDGKGIAKISNDSFVNHKAEQQQEQEVDVSGETIFVNDFTLYKCALCPLRFDSVEQLNKHIDSNQHRAESMACCLVCTKSVPSRLLQSHLKNHAGARKPHPCPHPECPLAFHRFEDWRNHILVHDFMADGSKPVPVSTKRITRIPSNTTRRVEKVDKNDPRIISTQLSINSKRSRVTPYSVLSNSLPSSSSFSSSSTVYCCPICRQQYRLKAHLELHLAQAHSSGGSNNNNNNTSSNTTTSNQGGRPVIFATTQPTPQPRYALIINKAGPNNNNDIIKSDNSPVCPHCKAVFISEDFLKTHLDQCTMKGQVNILINNGFGGTAKFVQLPPQVQKPRQVIFVPRSQTNNNNNINSSNILGHSVVNEASIGFDNNDYGSSLLQHQHQDIKTEYHSVPPQQNQPFKATEPTGRKIGILRKTISR